MKDSGARLLMPPICLILGAQNGTLPRNFRKDDFARMITRHTLLSIETDRPFIVLSLGVLNLGFTPRRLILSHGLDLGSIYLG